MSPHMTNFRGEDMPGRISHAVDSPPPSENEGTGEGTDDGKDKDKDKAAPESQSADDDDDVPAGTTTEILSWVGEDKARAQAALDTEESSERPRTGLTSELKKILGS